jgi:hypothetical protein
LHEYSQATGDPAARDAAGRAAELFLAHRLFRRLADGQVINRAWLAPRYPPYWHYDILQPLLVLSRMGMAADPRAGDALDELERRRLPDGRPASHRPRPNPQPALITPVSRQEDSCHRPRAISPDAGPVPGSSDPRPPHGRGHPRWTFVADPLHHYMETGTLTGPQRTRGQYSAQLAGKAAGRVHRRSLGPRTDDPRRRAS